MNVTESLPMKGNAFTLRKLANELCKSILDYMCRLL